MRGNDQQQSGMFSYISLEERIPQDHPLRPIRKAVDEIFRSMNQAFDGLYAKTGRPSIPPERLLRALLLQIFYSIRSERMLMEQMEYNLLFRWFVGMEMDEPVWNHAVFSKNRERLLNQEVAQTFFGRVLAQAKPHLSDEHFTVDGTLIEAWASQKSFQKKDDGGEGDGSQFRGDRRRNDTHESQTDPDAKLYRKGGGQEAKLGYLGHVLMENRNGLIVDAMVTQADGRAERDGAADDAPEMAAEPPLGSAEADQCGGRQGLRHARFRRHTARLWRAAACDAECKSPWRQRHRRSDGTSATDRTPTWYWSQRRLSYCHSPGQRSEQQHHRQAYQPMLRP